MALLDLHKDLLRVTAPQPSTSASQSTPNSASSRKVEVVYTDEHVEKELTTAVLKLLADPIAEVKNSAVAWYVISLLFGQRRKKGIGQLADLG